MHGTFGTTAGTASSVRDFLDAVYAARARGDVAAVLASMTDDATYQVMAQNGGVSFTPAITGKPALAAYFPGLFQRWVWDGMAVRNIIVGDGQAVVETSGQMIYTVSNQRFETAICAVLQLRDGKISAIREYCDSFTIVRIAGLSL